MDQSRLLGQALCCQVWKELAQDVEGMVLSRERVEGKAKESLHRKRRAANMERGKRDSGN